MAAKLSKKKLKFIRSKYPTLSIPEIAKELRVEQKTVRSALEEFGMLDVEKGNKQARDPAVVPWLPSTRQLAAIALIYAILVGVIYSNALNNPFLYDDHHSILENTSIRKVSNIKTFFKDPKLFSYLPGKVMYRPLLLSTYALNYSISKYNSFGWHLFNVALHVINGLLVCLILVSFCRHFRLAAALGAIFICHPLVTEGINYLSARSSLMAGTFFFSSLLFYIHFSFSGKLKLIAASIFCYVLGLLTKENLLILPLLILCYEALFHQGSLAEAIKKRWWAILCFIAPAALFILLRSTKLHLETFIMPADSSQIIPRYLTQTGVMTYYLRLIFFPYGQNAFHFIPITLKPWVNGFPIYQWPIFSMVTFSLLFAGGFLTKSRVFIFGLLWYLVSLIPESAVPLNQIANERRLYVPLLGILIALSVPLSFALTRQNLKRAAIAAGVVTIICFGFLAHKRNKVWSSEYSLFLDVTKKSPQTVNAWHGFAYAVKQKAKEYQDKGDTPAAKREAARAKKAMELGLRIDPGYGPGLILYGVILEELGEHEKAIEALQKSFIREGQNPKAHYNIAIAYMKLNRLAEAEKHAKLAVKYTPEYSDAFNVLGVIAIRGQNFDQAGVYLEEAIRLNPENESAKKNLWAVNNRPR